MAASLSISRLILSSPTQISTTAATAKSFLSFVPLKPNRLSKPLKTTTRKFSTISATISVGDKLPEATLSYFDSEGELQTTTISSLTSGKKINPFRCPRRLHPNMLSETPSRFRGEVSRAKVKGVDTIACISVNDAFVMRAWKENLGIGDDGVLLLSDGNGDFTKAIGCELDLSDKPIGLGVRSRRYALLAEDGVVKVLNLEEGGAFTSSGAEDMLKAL